jgi:hypothetical protein
VKNAAESAMICTSVRITLWLSGQETPQRVTAEAFEDTGRGYAEGFSAGYVGGVGAEQRSLSPGL